jgi:biopolymer transport protein ExbD
MRIISQSAQRASLSFNITPLIDVVFLLIIFFLVASHFVRNEKAAAVSLPESVQGRRDTETAARRLTITISSDGILSVSGVPLSDEQLTAHLSSLRDAAKRSGAPPEVRIRSDQQADYVHLRKLIERCAAYNIRNIQFAVVPKSYDE